MDSLKIDPNTDLNNVFHKKDVNNDIIVVDEVIVGFKTPIRKAILSNQILPKILNLIEPINFIDFVDIDNGMLTNEKKPKTDLEDEEKYVVIMENLLIKADQASLGLIMDNYSVLVYNTTYWESTNLNLFKSFLSEVAIRSGFPTLKSRKKRVNEILFNQFTFTAASYIEKNNSDVVKINLLNGTFHVKNSGSSEGNVLKPANKEDYFKYQLSFDYCPDAKSPLFDKFLNEVLPDESCQKIILEYIAYCLTKHLKLERVLILYGVGRNGKSTFFDVINALLGQENVGTTDMRKLCDENGYFRVGLDTKLLNYASEFGGKIDNQMFKKLISGEPVDARSPNKEPIVVRDYCKFIFNTNKLPEVEQTEAFFRRPMIIPFNKIIDKSKVDIHLSKKIIKHELSGIFNHVLKALDRLLIQNDFSHSELIDNELAQYKKESNTVSLFLEEENWVISPTENILKKELYPLYLKYCIANGYIHPVNSNNFSKRLRELGFTVKQSTGNLFYVWAKKDTSNDEKDPFVTFLKNEDNDIVSEILNNK